MVAYTSPPIRILSPAAADRALARLAWMLPTAPMRPAPPDIRNLPGRVERACPMTVCVICPTCHCMPQQEKRQLLPDLCKSGRLRCFRRRPDHRHRRRDFGFVSGDGRNHGVNQPEIRATGAGELHFVSAGRTTYFGLSRCHNGSNIVPCQQGSPNCTLSAANDNTKGYYTLGYYAVPDTIWQPDWAASMQLNYSTTGIHWALSQPQPTLP